jgi:septal ring-binding cell division protein DamX
VRRREPERGRQGDHGQDGVEGPRGIQGIQGKPGLRSRSLTWVQALVMFLLIVMIGIVLSYRAEQNSRRIEETQRQQAEQQKDIIANSARIAEERYRSCAGGVQIIERFNRQMRDLVEIERRNTKDPLAKERIKAYEDGVQPVRVCRR